MSTDALLQGGGNKKEEPQIVQSVTFVFSCQTLTPFCKMNFTLMLTAKREKTVNSKERMAIFAETHIAVDEAAQSVVDSLMSSSQPVLAYPPGVELSSEEWAHLAGLRFFSADASRVGFCFGSPEALNMHEVFTQELKFGP